MSAEYKTHLAAYGWKLPFNLALLFHIVLVTSALILPKYIQKKPVFPEFLSVDLVNIAAPLPQPVTTVTPPPPASPQSKVTIQKLKSVEPRKTAPISPVVAEESVVVPIKAISIKPLKRKKKKILPPDTSARDKRRAREAEQKKQQQALAILRQQLMQEAQRQKALADAEKEAADEAVSALKNMLQADAAVVSSSPKPRASTPNRGGGSTNIIESQYQSSIFSSLQEHWALPEIKSWNPELTAVVVIHIAKNGRIIKHRFEKKSGDRVFDQFVNRTIQEANPLPGIPEAMRVQQYRVGLRFKPGQIQ